jgi:hypothetical protein
MLLLAPVVIIAVTGFSLGNIFGALVEGGDDRSGGSAVILDSRRLE